MRIVKIQGGLGNQMFQYAFACKLKHLFPDEEVYLDLSSFKRDGVRRFELEYVFGISLPIASSRQLLKFAMPIPTKTRWGNIIHRVSGFLFNSIIYTEKRPDFFSYTREPLSIPKSCYYDGTWFNEGYFHEMASEMKNDFSFKRPLNASAARVKEEILNTNSVSIHVRRGDYLLYDAYKGICDKDYYDRAIQFVKLHIDNPHFFIFSNDIAWCKGNLNSMGKQCSFVENNDPDNNYIDMQLMSLCKHNIIAHSSFSWWSAWLNENPNKLVIAPNKWINSPDIPNKPQLEEWILIS